LGIITNADKWVSQQDQNQLFPLWSAADYAKADQRHPQLNFVASGIADLTPDFLNQIKSDSTAVLVFETNNLAGMPEQRSMFIALLENQIEVPVIVKRKYSDLSEEDFQLHSATDLGGLFIDGLGDGAWLSTLNCGGLQVVNQTAFGILQATRTRISKTEYISCPSCGRTLFDLQETTAKIRSRTDHLKGVKIGIMGCIVNGPGEMADADYGYVGTGVGKITLYKEKEVVKRNVPAENAVDELIELIREHGDWVERTE